LTFSRHRLPTLSFACVAALGLCLIALQAPITLDARPAGSLSGLKVVGNRITDGAGTPLMLRGFNRSGTEYACIELGSPGNLGWGIFDGPSDLASVQAMRSWHANYVRLPLNEDCWLGINGVSPTYGGASYRAAIASFVNLLNSNSMYVELSLIWGAPGTTPATSQPAAPDQDHSPAFWTSVATTFKSNPDVFFGVWGEPTVTWSCFLNGCSNEAGYQTAGSQELVNAIRAAGASQPIAVPGINYANDLSQWLAYKPTDSLNALVAEAHIYGNNSCGAQSGGACLTIQIAPVAVQVPVIFGETGETYDDSECTSANMQVILPWADAHNVGYAAWTWDTWGTCLSLISGYDGTPNTTTPSGAAYGQYVHDHLLAVSHGRFPVTPSGSSGPGARTGTAQSTPPASPAPRISWRRAPHIGTSRP
jgi:Cellulase (glycosyl hydrolase family 5)